MILIITTTTKTTFSLASLRRKLIIGTGYTRKDEDGFFYSKYPGGSQASKRKTGEYEALAGYDVWIQMANEGMARRFNHNAITALPRLSWYNNNNKLTYLM